MNFTRKIKAGLVKVDLNLFVGEYGTIFYNEDTGDLRLSDGVTPGGIPLGAGGGGGATVFRQLTDTPSTYVGSAGYFVKVKQDATGLEFVNQIIFDGDFNNLTNKPTTLAGYGITDAFSGSWDDLTDKPTLFSGDYNDLTNLPTLFSGSWDDLTDKPTLFSGDYNDLTNLPTLFSGSWDDLTDKPNALSVGVVDTNNTLISNTTDVTAIRFDTDSGFDVVDLGSGIVKVQMNSTFKTWKAAGQQDLIATGLDTVEFVAGTGIAIELDPNGSPYQQIKITNTGGGTGGGATTLNQLTDVAYSTFDIQIGDTLTWNGTQWVPDTDSTARGLNDLFDVTYDSSIQVGDTLTWNGYEFVPDTDSTARGLNDLFDVAYDSSVAVGDVLKWNGYEWVPGTDQQGTGGGSGNLLGVIIDLSIDNDGDLILTHVDNFSADNAFINNNGEFVFTDGL